MMAIFRRYFISGLLVWVPIWVTILAIKFLVDMLDSVFSLFPQKLRPDNFVGYHVPGLGIVLTVALILITGAIAANFVGSRIVALWDNFVGRIPLVRSVYSGVKQVMHTLFKPGGQSFRKVLLVEYPRAGAWTIAFQAGEAAKEVSQSLNEKEMVSLYVPTTPNPTSGFLLMVAKDKVIELDMSVDQALKFVISLGVVQPTLNNGHSNNFPSNNNIPVSSSEKR